MNENSSDAAPLRKERPNKTKLKKESLELTDFAKSLSELSQSERDSLVLPDNLEKALNDFINTKAHIAKKRQGQYLGKVMRQLPIDAQEAIQTKAAALFELRETKTAFFHQVELWREKLLEDDKSALTDFISAYPTTDRQALRHLIQKTKKERLSHHSQGHYKALFRFLRDIITK